MARSNRNGRKNNNPEGHNQYSGGLKQTVRNNPIASAAAAGGAVAAGLFLWSKRDKIGEQMNQMGSKAREWSDERKARRHSGDGSTMSGKRSSETGTETIGQPAVSSTATGSKAGASRSTGGRSGKAQTGQNMNPSRTATEAVTY